MDLRDLDSGNNSPKSRPSSPGRAGEGLALPEDWSWESNKTPQNSPKSAKVLRELTHHAIDSIRANASNGVLGSTSESERGEASGRAAAVDGAGNKDSDGNLFRERRLAADPQVHEGYGNAVLIAPALVLLLILWYLFRRSIRSWVTYPKAKMGSDVPHALTEIVIHTHDNARCLDYHTKGF